MNRLEVAKAISKTCKLQGSFRLRSGSTVDTYFDKYRFESDPALLNEIAKQLLENLKEKNFLDSIDYIAGMEMGGIPIVAHLSMLTGIPSVFVRKKAKEYGTCNLVEGADIEGKNLLIVEDVVTTGGAILDSLPLLRERGATISKAVCVILREPIGFKNLAEASVDLSFLFKKEEVS